MKTIKAVTLVFAFFAASVVQADVIEIAAGGDIASAVLAAQAGDVVQLAPGTYVLTAAVSVARPITVKGSGKLLTRIESDGGTHRLFHLNHADAVLSDVTLAGATADNGGAGVYIETGTLQDSIVRDCKNTQGYSGGVYIKDGAMRRCVLTGNNCVSGGGGGVFVKNSAVIENTLVYNNEATWGGGIYADGWSKVALVNCTVADNLAHSNGHDTYDYTGGGKLCATNTILGVLVRSANSEYVNSFDSATDPHYVSAPARNYRISSQSPLLNAGVTVDCTRDLDGNPFSETPSVGAFQPVVTPTFELSADMIQIGGTVTVTVRFPPAVAGGEGVLYVVASDGSSMSYIVADNASQSVELTAAGTYSLALQATSGDVFASADMYNAFSANIENVYVNSQSANPVSPYSTPETAARTLEDAFSVVSEEGTVWICDCTYEVSSTFVLNRNVAVKGLNGREKAIILQAGVNRIFSLDHPKAKLSGLTLRGSGSAGESGLGVYIGLGGGLAEDCLFENFLSASGSGAAVFAELGEATLERCVFRNNKAGKYGGGAYAGAQGRLNLRNCLFYGNTAAKNWGSAVYVDGPGTMVNCTLYNNSVSPVGNGEFCRCHADFAVTNCIFGSVNWYTGTSNRDNNLGGSSSLANPGFCDAANGDYRLAGTAVLAIDQGEDSAVMAGETDLAGKRRICGDHVDLGCYEYSEGEFSAVFAIDGMATVVGDSVRLVPTVTGGNNPVNSWRAVNIASGTTIAGETKGSGEGAAFTVNFTEPGVWSFFYSVTDGENASDSSIERAVTISASGDVYVATSGLPVAPFDTPQKATTNLWVASKIAPDGATIHMLPGVHVVYERIAINRGMQLVGAGADCTIVTCPPNSNFGILSLGHAASVVRGVTVTGGFGEGYNDGPGGGVRVTAGLVTECQFSNLVQNASVRGAGIDLTGVESRVSRCVFTGCSTKQYGGAISAQGLAVVDNCLVTDSQAGSGQNQWGGLLYVEDRRACAISNCTFAGAGPRTIYTYRGGCKFVNCVFDCAIFPESGVIQTNAFFNCASSPSVAEGSENSHAIPEQNLVANDNQSEVEIGFVDAANGDYHLNRHSPCRRAGVFEPCMRKTVDLDGRRRTAGHTVDLGCYQDTSNGLTIYVN